MARGPHSPRRAVMDRGRLPCPYHRPLSSPLSDIRIISSPDPGAPTAPSLLLTVRQVPHMPATRACPLFLLLSRRRTRRVVLQYVMRGVFAWQGAALDFWKDTRSVWCYCNC